ncbi:putative carbohydrate esterase family 16 protein [Botrytis fragariae]|uniref:Putative carbohydrate esterase family 16 protein n=1 Tax=Botrytis fragariae TaxID=1964551 RepID=A0A8H6EEG5_9HELO|nr:putative carbohydrate esterase family 16 protein [Botrytis fragariae]KAF5869297.1 putative carbohydrate esterase family 16 protein [Botrytis fragariae]
MVFINSKSLPLAAGLFISATSAADVALYGQCGGSGFTGSTSCVSGAVCQSQNAFYYQCVAGAATATSAAEVVSSTAVAPVTTALAISSLAPAASSSALQVSSATTKKKCSSTTFATSVAKQSTSVASSSIIVQASSAAQAISSQISSAQSVVASSVQSSAVVASSSSTSSVPLISTTFAALPTAIVSTSAALLTSTQAAVVATSSSSAAVASTASSSASSGTKYLMVFGDSYTSDGFYGGATLPSAENPLGVALPGSTTDGGLGWLGVVATELNSSLVLGYDYAEYGATTDNTLVNGATHDLIAQVTEFSTYAAHDVSTAPWTEDNTMAIVWMGINDVGNSYWDGFVTPFDNILDVYFAQLQILYDAGIRYFTLFTIPPFDQAPVFAEQTAQNMDYVRGNITTYNNDLVTRLATFEAANSGVTGTIFNTTESFYTVLDDPTTYGSPDATCMNADGTSCLWYDTYHPGQAIQKLVAENFVKATSGIFSL